MADSETGSPAQPSIHWRQRWWYALWVALLLACLGFWAWWERPATSGKGHVVLLIHVADLPSGSRVSAWAGPRKAWRMDAPGSQGPWAVADDAKYLPVPPLEIREGLRHWRQGYIPRLTSDRLVLRLDPPQGPPRFMEYDLRADLNAGAAGIHRRLLASALLRWSQISTDATHPTPLLP